MAGSNPFIIDFDFNAPGHATVSTWRIAGSGLWDTNARHYAALHGESRVLLADGRVKRFWNDEGKVRQRTYKKVSIAR